jgi:hypothetical protein
MLRDCGEVTGTDWRAVDVRDPIIYQSLQDFKHRYGIFQLETWAQGTAAQKVKPKSFEQLSAVLAIARPGAIAFLDTFAKYVNEGEFTSVHPLIDDILRPTGGIAAYQEQMLQMLVRVGLTPEESEAIRKIIGKKLKEKVPEAKAKISEVCARNGHPPEITDLLLKIMEDSGGYSFAKCLSPDSVVEGPDGYKLMHEVKPGDLVKAYDVVSQKDHFVPVIRVYESTSVMYEVELDDGRCIRCSMEHKFLCKDGVMRPLRQILEERIKILTD